MWSAEYPRLSIVSERASTAVRVALEWGARHPFAEAVLSNRTWSARLNKYAPITRNIELLIPRHHAEVFTESSIMAPIRFAPKTEDGLEALRKVVEKIRPPKQG